jgi:hypothetical protein
MPKRAKQPTPRQIACRANGRKGGLARAKKLTKKEIVAIAIKGGNKLHQKHGDDYYSFIASRRKTVGRYRTPVSLNRKLNKLVRERVHAYSRRLRAA